MLNEVEGRHVLQICTTNEVGMLSGCEHLCGLSFENTAQQTTKIVIVPNIVLKFHDVDLHYLGILYHSPLNVHLFLC